MSSYLALKFLHLIAFVYWLGGDLGTFIASRQVTRQDLSVEARATALRIMLACDMGPKLAMPIILPLGVELAWSSGMLQFPMWIMGTLWLFCLVWFVMVLVVYLKEGSALAQRTAVLDFALRIFVIVALMSLAASIFTGLIPASGHWLGWKLVIFCFLVLSGLAIRVHLKPFGRAFSDLISGSNTQESNAIIRSSVARCRPWVACIWVGLLLNAALGLRLIQ